MKRHEDVFDINWGLAQARAVARRETRDLRRGSEMKGCWNYHVNDEHVALDEAVPVGVRIKMSFRHLNFFHEDYGGFLAPAYYASLFCYLTMAFFHDAFRAGSW